MDEGDFSIIGNSVVIGCSKQVMVLEFDYMYFPAEEAESSTTEVGRVREGTLFCCIAALPPKRPSREDRLRRGQKPAESGLEVKSTEN